MRSLATGNEGLLVGIRIKALICFAWSITPSVFIAGFSRPQFTMFKIAILVACVCIAAAQRFGQPQEVFPPIPYSFSYSSSDQEGTHTREESGDGAGRVTGKYTMQLADGRVRTVTYVSDELGYRAQIVTNELGTESKNPADVVIQSSAPTGPEAAIANEPNRPRGGFQRG